MAPKEVIFCMDDEIRWEEYDSPKKMTKEEYERYVELFRKAQQELEPSYSERDVTRRYFE